MPAQSPSDTEDLPSPSPPPRKRKGSYDTVNAPTSSGSGIVSNVLSFVSREIKEFVVNATGGSEPVAGPSHEHRVMAQRTEKRHGRQSTPLQPHANARVSKRLRSEGLDYRSLELYEDLVEDADVREHGRKGSRTSSPPLSRHRRRASVSMPGSLFPRSPTPELRHASPDIKSERRHVRFASDVVSPLPRQRPNTFLSVPGHAAGENEYDSKDEDYDGGSSSSPDRGDDTIYPPLSSPSRDLSSVGSGSSLRSQPVTPFRAQAVHSVKDAVARLDGDSPPRNARLTVPNATLKGKISEAESHVQWPDIDKGKGKEPARPRLDAVSRLPSAVGSSKGARRTDHFLRNASRCSDEHEDNLESEQAVLEDDVTKRRIQELEAKIKCLEDELARRPPAREFTIPPPPPPPPPPTGPASRIPLTSSPCRDSGVNSVLASVRAGLKQPPSGLGSSKVIPKNRLPTVPADKMEAFLNELKTVRLRKVGSKSSLGCDNTANRSGTLDWKKIDHSLSSLGSSSEARATVGDKRKRVDSGNQAQGALVMSIRRRFNAPSSSVAVSSSTAGPSTRTFFAPPRLSTLAHLRNPETVALIPTEQDGTTPSLCSDNDNDLEDRAPSTPPQRPSRTSTADEIPLLHKDQHHSHSSRGENTESRNGGTRTHVDRVSAISTSHLTTTTTGTCSVPQHVTVDADDNPFSRRPPSSPLPPETPRRPRPPARPRSGAATTAAAAGRPPIPARRRSPSQPDEDDDPLSLSFSPLVDESTPALDAGRRREGRRRRRMTLDEEIKKAAPDSSGYSEEERALNELESGILVGVGQRSKRLGFMAHGGAGGDPVFMGVGYVEGAIGERDDEKHGEGGEEKASGGAKSRGVIKQKPKR